MIAWQVAALETAVTSVLLPAASHQVGYIPPPLTSLVSASTAFTSAYFSICKFSGGNNRVLVKVGLLDQVLDSIDYSSSKLLASSSPIVINNYDNCKMLIGHIVVHIGGINCECSGVWGIVLQAPSLANSKL